MSNVSHHNGAPALLPLIVDDGGHIEALPNQQKAQGEFGRRRYAALVADVNNTEPIYFLFYNPGEDIEDDTLREQAIEDFRFNVGDGGLPLQPGESYEIGLPNLYTGSVWVAASGSQTLHRALGK